MPPSRTDILAAVKAELWHRGDLSWLLDKNQLADRASIWSKPTEDYVLDVSRQTGKSWLCAVLAIEHCLTTPAAQVKYASKTQKSVRSIIEPLFKEILRTCPDELRPRYNEQQGFYDFPSTEARITVAGTDGGHYENLRGQRATLIIKDEAGFFDNPHEVDAVLSPQRLTTNGIIIEASTPPETPGHPFTPRAMSARAAGRYSHRTIYEHARMTHAQVEAFLAKEASLRGLSLNEFKATSTFKREYLAEHVVDEARAVVPEWTSREPSLLVAVARPRWAEHYVGLDVGFRDGMAAVFAYWDFARASLVVEDELLLFGVTTPQVAQAIREKEAALWPTSMPQPFREAGATNWGAWAPFRRIADNDLQLINDLTLVAGIEFTATRKDDKELQVNHLRTMVAAGKVLIPPRCQRLAKQLRETIWNKQRSSYERTQDGHGDLIDALVYLLRNVAKERNPVPPFWDADPRKQWIPEHSDLDEDQETLRGIFSLSS